MNVLLLTSIIFITVAFHAFIKNFIFYSVSWLGLMITSLLYHSSYNTEIYYYFDQCMIYAVVTMGLYKFLFIKEFLYTVIPIITFLMTIIIYKLKLAHHLFVHILGIIGHHSILLAF